MVLDEWMDDFVSINRTILHAYKNKQCFSSKAPSLDPSADTYRPEVDVMDSVENEVSIFLARLSLAMFESAEVAAVFCVHNIFQSMFERPQQQRQLCQ